MLKARVALSVFRLKILEESKWILMFLITSTFHHTQPLWMCFSVVRSVTTPNRLPLCCFYELNRWSSVILIHLKSSHSYYKVFKVVTAHIWFHSCHNWLVTDDLISYYISDTFSDNTYTVLAPCHVCIHALARTHKHTHTDTCYK